MSRPEPQKILVVMPTWLGDIVMATPTLRALRARFPTAHISGLVSAAMRPILEPCPDLDSIVEAGAKGGASSLLAAARQLRLERFDLAVLLPNSFRAAMLVALAGIPRRVGYSRDGRGWLLTDRLTPLREGRRFAKVPTRDYYLEIARYLGAVDPPVAMRLSMLPEDEAQADSLLAAAGYDGQKPLVLLNPGANYGSAKMWIPERFAAVGDRCVEAFGAAVAVSGSPGERRILDEVIAAARHPIIDLQRAGIGLRLLKSVIARASVMVTNDTGPRHIAAALDVPVVTIFGPTDPAWTTIDFEKERQVLVPVDCGPCQQKVCPLGHQKCMTRLEPETVFAAVSELLGGEPGHGGDADSGDGGSRVRLEVLPS